MTVRTPWKRRVRGDAIILVLGLLVLFMAAALAYLLTARTGARISHYSLHELKARETAEAGVAEALLRLDRDDPAQDHYGEDWHDYFRGDDVDNNGDGIPDSRWITVSDRERVVGRYAVLVEDEAAKVHFNAAGNIAEAGKHLVDRGSRVHEIDPAALPGFSAGQAAAICRWRYGSDGIPGLSGHPEDFRPARPAGDDRPFLSVEDIKEVPGVGPAAYEAVRNLATIYSYDRNVDARLAPRVCLLRTSLSEIADGLRRSGYEDEAQIAQVTANIRDFFDEDDVPSVTVCSAGRRYYGLEETPCLNEVEAAPDLRLKTIGNTIVLWLGRGEFVELFNPYPRALKIGGYRVKIGDEAVTLKPGATIPARGHYTIGDALAWRVEMKFVPVGGVPVPIPVGALPVQIREPDGCDQYHPFNLLPFSGAPATLSDAAGNTIENTNYGGDLFGSASRQKNDPRMRGPDDWFTAPSTPGARNEVFLPEVGLEADAGNWPGHFVIRNRACETVGELGFVHLDRQWRTINLWRSEPADLKTQDIFTAADPPGVPVAGRVNLNTAPPEVMAALPGLDIAAAREIAAARPYLHHGEVGPVLDRVSRRDGTWGYGPEDHTGDGFTGGDPDREHRYRLISNLVTVKTNVFLLRVTGQSVRDSGKNGKIMPQDILAEKCIYGVFDRGVRRGDFLRWKAE